LFADYDRGRDVDSPLGPGIQTEIDAVEAPLFSAIEKFRTQPSVEKILATIFWDCSVVLLIDYFPHKTTINGPYNAALMD
jgi:hypothetical protein